MLDNPKNDQVQNQSEDQMEYGIADDQAKGGQATTDFDEEIVEDTKLIEDTETEEETEE